MIAAPPPPPPAVTAADILAHKGPPGIERQHPYSYVQLAVEMTKRQLNDEAVYWFYVGQLRWRFDLLARPDQKPDEGPALFGSMMEVFGEPLNKYAFGDIPKLVATWDEVLAWDAAHDNGYTSKTRYAAAWMKSRDGLKGLRAKTLADRAEIERKRAENGLENRNPLR